MSHTEFCLCAHDVCVMCTDNYLLVDVTNMQISIAKNVPMMTYETSTRNISFMAGFERMASVTVRNVIPARNPRTCDELCDT